MVSVGWAVFNAVEGSVTLPNFNEYNACGEVRRSNNAERQQRYRDKIKAEKEAELRNVTRNVTNNDREEKNREEKKDKDPQPPRGDGKNFDFNSLELPEWLQVEVWRQWGEFCIELGKPIKTQRAAMAAIKRLDEFRQQGYSPESVIFIVSRMIGKLYHHRWESNPNQRVLITMVRSIGSYCKSAAR